MNPNQSPSLLDAVCRRGVLVATSVRYWRGCKKLSPEDLGLDPAHVSERLIQLGHKRLIPRDALQAFALIESRVQATVESSSFPFLGGIGRFVPNPRLGDLTDKIEKLRDEFRDATLDFVAGYSPLRDKALIEWREAAQHMNGSAERLIATIEQSFPPAGDIAKRFAFETRLFQIAAPDSIRLEVAEGSADDKLEIYEELRATHREGVVFKDMDAPYSPGRPNSGGAQLKFKFVESASFIVTGHNAKRSVTLGLYDGDELVPAGNVTIPPNHRMPEVGEVCEVRYLYAYRESGSIYQPVYLGRRDDVPASECVVEQLKYKAELKDDA
jgi:hypothetical protein